MVYEDDDEGEVKEDGNIIEESKKRKEKIVEGTMMKKAKRISKMKME